LGAATESNRTILSDDSPVFVLYRLSERFGLPVVPEWADWFISELKRRRVIRPLVGLGCSPVLITGTKARFMSWISRGLRRGAIKFPENNGPIGWPQIASFLDRQCVSQLRTAVAKREVRWGPPVRWPRRFSAETTRSRGNQSCYRAIL